jgi:hypothetical protein
MTSVTNTVDISSSINLQTNSGVLSQMTIYTCPMETSFQQTIFQILKAIVVVYTIKTGMSNRWQLSGGCL